MSFPTLAVVDAAGVSQTRNTIPNAGQAASAESLPVVLSSEQQAILSAIVTALSSVAVTGTFYPATQPVSGTFWQATQPVSLASQPLPTGASTETTLAAASAKLPATLGQKAGSASMAVVPASDVIAPISYPRATSAVITSVQTSATGATYVAFASQACAALSVSNTTGTTLEYRRGAAGTAMDIPDGTTYLIVGITNANQIDVRRKDTSNTQVTMKAEALT